MSKTTQKPNRRPLPSLTSTSSSDIDHESESDNDLPGPSRSPVKKIKSKKFGSAKRKGERPYKKDVQKQKSMASRIPLNTGVAAQVRALQESTRLCIRRLPFSRLVREVQTKIQPLVTHWERTAIMMLHEAAEAYMVRFFEDCNITAQFANRVTIKRNDSQFVRRMRNRLNTY